jgi:uncharacterized damage-inducible protein DinB
MSSLLDETLQAWSYAREGVIAEVQNLPAARLTFRPHPAARTAAEIAFHIVETAQMMAGELSRADGDFRRKSFPQFIKEYAGSLRPTTNKAELVRLLKRTHAEGDKKIRSAGEVRMLQTIVQFNGVPATRLTWMNHGIAHEEYHRGQLALYARLAGETPALTKLIRGDS